MNFSANLGFLWTELSLPDAIRAAKAAGFDAVECHWPYDTPSKEVKAALVETGMPMLGLNTVRGNPGENGLSTLPGRHSEARAAIDQAIEYADEINAGAIHVMAGFAQGADARTCFIENLQYAASNAENKTILIEPLNHYDAPGYFLQTTDQAVAIIDELDLPNVKLMFDCYHVQLMEGDLSHRLTKLQTHIGHIQFAGVPERGDPAAGEVNYSHIFRHINEIGYAKPLGAEYKPNGPTEPTLGWLKGDLLLQLPR